MRLSRGDEPKELRRERVWRIARALLYETGECTDTDSGYNHVHAREALEQAQHGLCAYCRENTIGVSHYDLEHFRPRAKYWWLTWSWRNLWISCAQCQAKAADFKLMPASERLQAPEIDDSAEDAFKLWLEQSKLLDPALDQPDEHIRIELQQSTRRWVWAPVPGSVRGAYTLRTLGLTTREGRRDCRNHHLQNRVIPDCKALLEVLSTSSAQERWKRIEDRYLLADVIWHVASLYCVKHFYHQHDLDEFGLHMPPYPDDAPSPSSTWSIELDIPDDRPDWLTGRALWWVRYITAKNNPPKKDVKQAIVEICRLKSLTYKDIADAISRSKQTVGKYVRELSEAGHVSVDERSKPFVVSV